MANPNRHEGQFAILWKIVILRAKILTFLGMVDFTPIFQGLWKDLTQL
jgi:hypothetical protein